MRMRDRMTPVRRVTNPEQDHTRQRARDLGSRQVDDSQRIERIEQSLIVEQRGIIVVPTMTFFRDGITGTSTFNPRIPMPSGSATFASSFGDEFLCPEEGAVVMIMANVSAALTAGTIGISVYVDGADVMTPGDCIIDSALAAPYNQRASWYAYSMEQGVPVSRGSTLALRFAATSVTQTVNATAYCCVALPAR